MKKKIIFAITTSFFAVATVFNMNLLQDNSLDDVSLEGIAVMARAQASEEIPGMENSCSAVATITLEDGREVSGCAKWKSKSECSNEC
jgi:hypothetical protein